MIGEGHKENFEGANVLYIDCGGGCLGNTHLSKIIKVGTEVDALVVRKLYLRKIDFKI